ncbi:acyl-CoA-like ligand-binding transcription factor [Streptomyces adelaidensis]|uniref:acyl-CoA-like ligand-binding transcription factor n=1 Tax=Streptomyces adelaidensis TaxID=2796465 RepID=UPI0019043F54|nr:hypothetical protein [Streptomyces adelaidensis]
MRLEECLDATRADGARINAALRTRPDEEPPLLAHHNAVGEWLTARDALRPAAAERWRALLRLVDTEPTLFAAYKRIRVGTQGESVAIIAHRLGVNPALDLRPAVVVAAAAGVLSAALRGWAREDRRDAGGGLTGWVNRTYNALTEQVDRSTV